MKIVSTFLLLLIINVLNAQLPAADLIKVKGGSVSIQPIMHASLVISYHNKNIYVDPSGKKANYDGLGAADIVLITDIHGDHFDTALLQSVVKPTTVLLVPKAVADKMPASLGRGKMIILNNGESTKVEGFSIAAVPMYNLPEAADAFHTKGRGNGYVLTIGKKKFYISGDTEDIPEMRSLKNIEVAFVCMNLPYTMPVEQAAQGVLAFKPKIVYPYHYRGQDTDVFKAIINKANKDIDVRLRNWYGMSK